MHIGPSGPQGPNIDDYISNGNPNLKDDANGEYVWVKHTDPKTNRCDEITGLEEIADKETCKTVVTGFMSNEFERFGFRAAPYDSSIEARWTPGLTGAPELWNGGDTSVPHLPVGCSVPNQGGYLWTGINAHITYQTATGISGTTYDGVRRDLKFCKRTPPVVQPEEDETQEDETQEDENPIINNRILIGVGVCLFVFLLILLWTKRK